VCVCVCVCALVIVDRGVTQNDMEQIE